MKKFVYSMLATMFLTFVFTISATSQNQMSSLPTATNEANWHIYRPDPTLTPGDTMTSDIKTICTPGYTTDVRVQTVKIKKELFRSYGINWRDHSMYEDDHFIPLVLGGSNELKNRFPQYYCPKETSASTCFGARQKDVVENYLHHYVCDKNIAKEEAKIRLDYAQKQIVKDWFAIYRKIKGF